MAHRAGEDSPGGCAAAAAREVAEVPGIRPVAADPAGLRHVAAGSSRGCRGSVEAAAADTTSCLLICKTKTWVAMHQIYGTIIRNISWTLANDRRISSEKVAWKKGS